MHFTWILFPHILYFVYTLSLEALLSSSRRLIHKASFLQVQTYRPLIMSWKERWAELSDETICFRSKPQVGRRSHTNIALTLS
jgi:hypothetical protein